MPLCGAFSSDKFYGCQSSYQSNSSPNGFYDSDDDDDIQSLSHLYFI